MEEGRKEADECPTSHPQAAAPGGAAGRLAAQLIIQPRWNCDKNRDKRTALGGRGEEIKMKKKAVGMIVIRKEMR